MRARALFFLLLFAGVFAFGILRLLGLRMEAGDVYPEYSTLRADPLGTRAFYEGLEGLPGVAPRRNFRPLARIDPPGNATLFFFGTAAWQMENAEEETVEQIEFLARSGSRVVIALLPDLSGFETAKEPAGQEKPEGARGRRRTRTTPVPTPTPEDGLRQPAPVSLADRWGFEIGSDGLRKSPAIALRRGEAQAAGTLPPSLPWRSGIRFTKLHPAWRVLYVRDSQPVFLERPFGKGTLVLASDSSFVSNAAMRKERQPELLAWLVGPHAEVIFDETHLGLSETRGVASLARKYRLHGVLVGLLALAALSVWRSSSPLLAPPPVHSDADAPESVAGKHAFEGLAAVLRRNIPASDILRVCYTEWRRSFPGGEPPGLKDVLRVPSEGKKRKSLRDVTNKRRDLVAAYRKASEMLKARRMSLRGTPSPQGKRS